MLTRKIGYNVSRRLGMTLGETTTFFLSGHMYHSSFQALLFVDRFTYFCLPNAYNKQPIPSLESTHLIWCLPLFM